MQLKVDEEVSIDMNMTDEQLATTYKDKLDAHYEAPIFHVISRVFKGLSGKKIIMPSKDFISHHNQKGVKCSIKANEGMIFCLDKSFMFVPKPATYVPIESIQVITMSRVGGALAASRTFDITMTQKGGVDYQFSNINRYVDGLVERLVSNSVLVKSNSHWKLSSRPKTFASRTKCWTTRPRY